MAASRLFQFRYSYERDLVDVFAKISIGASGAPTLDTTAKGVLSVTRNSAGDYSIALKDTFNKLVMVDAVVKNATGIPDVVVGVKTDSVSSATAPLVRIVCSASGSAADPANGDVLMIQITCRNAST